MEQRRKAFNFLRSYYDVIDEIHDDKDKLDYLMAILDKQFKGVEPQLTGIPKLSYVGQKHSIDTSRKGWEDKVGYEPPTLTLDPTLTIGGSQGGIEPPTLTYPQNAPMTTEPPTEGGTEPPYLQEQEQEKEEVKEYTSSRESVNMTLTYNELDEQQKRTFYNKSKADIEYLITNYNYTLDKAMEIQYSTEQELNIFEL